MRESDLLRLCLDYLALVQVPSWRTNAGAVRLPSRIGKEWFVRFTAAKCHKARKVTRGAVPYPEKS
jgi:hypothetical protein